jgi:palmitoyltransferase ZDHHC13/17
MSSDEQPSSSAAGAPTQPGSKADASAPQLSTDSVEMGSLSAKDAPPPENDVMQMARVGNIAAMEKLFEAGDVDATYTDDEGITPLHVSACIWSRQKRGKADRLCV